MITKTVVFKPSKQIITFERPFTVILNLRFCHPELDSGSRPCWASINQKNNLKAPLLHARGDPESSSG
tara:strand:+ start:95 stop:298 length:204 start_codon:yes stop_codon:yes gene_type:complete